MEIRRKITYQFVVIFALLLLFSLLFIFFSFNTFRNEEFRERLLTRARNVGQLVAESERLDERMFQRMEFNNPTNLPREQIVVYDLSGKLLLAHGEIDTNLLSNISLKEVIEKRELHRKLKQNDIYGFYYEGNTKDVIVLCASEDIFGLRKLKELGMILAFVFGFNVVIVFILGRIFAARALKPISEVIDQVNMLDISSMNRRVSAGSEQDEIAELAETFNRLLDRLEAAIRMQKDFIANSSHELRTPLTVITGQIDVALLKKRTPEEYRATMVTVLDEIKRLTALTNKLLILSRTGTDFHAERFEEVRIDDVLWRSRDEVLINHPGYAIHIDFDESIAGEHHFNLKGNSQLLKAAFVNLIENGCKYSPDNSVNIRLVADENTLEIVFSDRGIGIPENDLEHIFEPFYRGSNVQDKGGHGIGLSLTDRIIKLHQGTIHVNSEPGKGTVFALRFFLG